MGNNDAMLMTNETANPGEQSIWDPAFRRAHERLVMLSVYSLQQVTSTNQTAHDAARLGPLNVTPFSNVPFHGRRASAQEWEEVEIRSCTLWTALSEPQRRRFASEQVPGWFSYVLSGLLIVALASVVVATLATLPGSQVPGGPLIPFMTFVIALGAMGASASIGMNALSVQDDATFDLSSPKFLWLRLVLGALFGTLLTLPWAFPGFLDFASALASPASATNDLSTSELLIRSSWLLAPFVLGFSTSLVILVLTRAVESLQTFFGKAGPTKT